MIPSFLPGSFCFLSSALFLRRLRGGARNGSGTSHFSTVNAQCSLNILRESLHYKLVKRLRKLLSLASLLAAIVLNVKRDGYESSERTTIKRRRCDESSASTSIKRRRFLEILLLLLPFSSFYRIGDIEVFMKKTIKVNIAYAEPLVQSIDSAKRESLKDGLVVVQQFLSPRFVILQSARVLRWGHIIWVKDSTLLAREPCHIHHLSGSAFGHTAFTIVIYVDTWIFHRNVIGLSWEEFNNITHASPD